VEENTEIIHKRRDDIDALRVYAVILLIIFHTAMLFAYGTPYFIQNSDLSVEILIFVFIVNIFHMPLFFLLAGMSTSYSLNFRTGAEYLKERVRRVFIPLILGILIVIPPIVYFERLAWWSDTRYNNENFNGTFFEFYPHFFEIGNFNYYHLWFIAYLFIFSLVALSLFLRLKKDEGKQKISSIAEKYGKGKKIFLFSLPLILFNVSLRWIFPGISKLFIDDLANVLFYLSIFIFGFLIVSDSRFENSIDRNKKVALILAIITSFIVIIFLGPGYDPFGNPVGYAIYWTSFSFSGWCWLIAIYGYGKKFLTKPNSVIKYLSKIALPMYIIHLTVIIIIAYYVLQWQANIAVKFLVIFISSLFITILLCELIKTNNVTRFIFGMRPKMKKREIN
jgi:peptidoglycan/LPS O-acetylase OafA/YrhL